MNEKIQTDFVLWLANPTDPDDFISLFPQTQRAMQWCEERGFRSRHPLNGVTNAMARKLRDELEAAGFHVLGAS